MSKKTIAELQLKTSGADKAAKDIDSVGKSTQRLNRNTTRLGQASASAGRSFSAQANGLGGLVGIYAAAAANVFAITAAFTALNRAAQFGTIIQGTQQLGQAVGTSGTEVVRTLKEITDGQLSVVEAATQANLALSAGFNVDQIEKLGSVALKASRALGRNLTDSFQRITRGAIKLEPELLDEIGIFTRIEPAVEAFAASINKSASQLTQFERRQAFVNQVIKDGEAAFADIQDEGSSTQEVFEKLVANFSDLAIVFGKFLADTLVPFAEFLDKNLGNRLILLGGIGALVFGKLREAIGGFVAVGLTSLSTSLERVADRFANVSRLGQEFVDQQKAAVGSFAGQGALAGPRGLGAQIKKDLAGGPVSTKRAQEIQKDLVVLKKAEAANQERLKNTVAKTADEQKKVTSALSKSQARSAALAATSKVIDRQLESAGLGANLLARGLRGASVAADFLGKALNRAFAIFNAVLIGFTTLQTVLSFFDIDLFSEVKDLISRIGKEARDAAKGVDAITAAAEKTKFELSKVKDLADKLDVDPSGVAELAKEIERISNLPPLTQRLEINKLKRELEALNSGGFSRFFQGDLFLGDAPERIKEIESILKGFTGTTSADTQKAVSELTELGKAVAKLSANLELGGEGLDIFGKLADAGFIKVEQGLLRIKTAAGELATLGEVATLGESLSQAGLDATTAASNLETLNRKLDEGSISASKASRDIGVIVSENQRAIDALGAVIDEFENSGRQAPASVVDAFEKLVRAQEEIKSGTQQVVNDFVNLDQLGTTLSKKFGGDFKLLDESFINGKVSAETGKIARNSEEAALFQAQNFKAIQDSLPALSEIEGQTSNIQAREEDITKLRKIAQADALKLVPILDKQLIAEKKKTDQLINQLNLLQLQRGLNNLKNENALIKLREANSAAERKRAIDVQSIESNITKEVEKQSAIRNKSLVSLMDARDSRLTQRDEGDLQVRAGQIAAKNNADALALEEAKRRTALIEATTVTTRQDLLNNELNILKAQRDNDLARISRERELILLKKSNDDKAQDREINAINRAEALAIGEANRKKAEIEAADTLAKSEADAQKLKLQDSIAAENRAIKEAREQKVIADTQAKNNRDSQVAALKILQAENKLQQDRLETFSAFLRGEEKLINERKKLAGVFTDGEGIADTFEQESKIVLESSAAIGNEITAQLAAVDAILVTSQGINSDNLQAAIDLGQARSDGFQAEIDGIDAVLSAQDRLKVERIKTIDAEITAIEAKARSDRLNIAQEGVLKDEESQRELDRLSVEKAAILATFEARKRQLEFELSFQFRLIDAGNEVAKTLKTGVVDGFMQLNDALIEGTLTISNLKDGFEDFASGLIKQIQRIFFQKTIAEPAADFLAKGFSSGFNELFAGGGGTDANLIGISGPLPGEGAMLGGPVKMAAGGMLRDRVPAMLEPGEFVIRKPAAKAIGGPALGAMNATGKMPGDVSINIQNEGSPKDAEAEQPRFDGEKFVIDVVMRDLSNNGPIRKSLRSGGAS